MGKISDAEKIKIQHDWLTEEFRLEAVQQMRAVDGDWKIECAMGHAIFGAGFRDAIQPASPSRRPGRFTYRVVSEAHPSWDDMSITLYLNGAEDGERRDRFRLDLFCWTCAPSPLPPCDCPAHLAEAEEARKPNDPAVAIPAELDPTVRDRAPHVASTPSLPPSPYRFDERDTMPASDLLRDARP